MDATFLGGNGESVRLRFRRGRSGVTEEGRGRWSDRIAATWRLAGLLTMSAAVLLPGLGTWGRLSYHEAFVAQGAREMLDSGDWAIRRSAAGPGWRSPPCPGGWSPRSAGSPAGWTRRWRDSPRRSPRRCWSSASPSWPRGTTGRRIGLIAGAVQATTAWTAMRGRLAEADMLLACLITWAIVAFDRLADADASDRGRARWRGRGGRSSCCWALTSLVKGIGFGAVLIVAVVGDVGRSGGATGRPCAGSCSRRAGSRRCRCRRPGRWR